MIAGSTGQVLTTEIVRLARGGNGVGRHPDGRVIFVRGGVPGDFVEVEITNVSDRFLEAHVIKVVTPSPHRISPPCPHFNECGGCPWQNVSYSEQLRQKREILRDTLVRGRALSGEEAAVFNDFFESPKQFRYRSRVTLQKRSLGQRNAIGYNRRDSHDFVAIDDCLIANEKLIPFARSLVDSKTHAVRDRFQVAIDETGRLEIGGAFTQVNAEQNFKLQSLVADFVTNHIRQRQEIVHWHFLDLFCGNGNLTFPVIELVRATFPDKVIEATGVEQTEESVLNARKNARAQQCRFYLEDVEKWLVRQRSGPSAQVTKKGLPLDEIILLDPPRAGCSKETMVRIARRRPSLVLYVSCDPATQARDIARLRETFRDLKSNYQIEKVVGLDLFPQTDHIESLVTLRRIAD